MGPQQSEREREREREAYRVTRHQVLKSYYQQTTDRRMLRKCIAAPSHYSDVVVPLGCIPVGDLAQAMATLTSSLPDWAQRPESPGAGRLGATLVVTEEDIATLDPLPCLYRGASVSSPEPPPGEILEHLGTGQGWTHRAMRRQGRATSAPAPASASAPASAAAPASAPAPAPASASAAPAQKDKVPHHPDDAAAPPRAGKRATSAVPRGARPEKRAATRAPRSNSLP